MVIRALLLSKRNGNHSGNDKMKLELQRLGCCRVVDLLLLQSIIRAPLIPEAEVVIRQASRSTMRETLKEVSKRHITKILVHLSTDDTYHLLRAVSRSIYEPPINQSIDRWIDQSVNQSINQSVFQSIDQLISRSDSSQSIS